jgi:hypothetical protein
MLNSGSVSLSLSFAGLSALATKTFDRSENSFSSFLSWTTTKAHGRRFIALGALSNPMGLVSDASALLGGVQRLNSRAQFVAPVPSTSADKTMFVSRSGSDTPA